MTDFKIPFNDFKPFINKYVCDKWQILWDVTPFNLLKEIEPIENRHRLVPKLSRGEEIVLARLRIGHTPFTVRHFVRLC